jgi:hypothetical protein
VTAGTASADTGSPGTPELSATYTELTMLVTDLWYEIDHHGGAAASRFFTADAELTFSRRTFRGTAAIDGVYRDRAARGPRVSRHLMSGFHILRHTTDAVEAVSALVLYAQDGEPPRPTTTPVLVADVLDRFVRSTEVRSGEVRSGEADGPERRWLIASRRIENRFLVPGDVLAVPTE